MLHTTFRRTKEAGACIDSYRKFAKHKGGITKYGADTPFPLVEVAEVLSIEDALWCFGCLVEETDGEKISRLLAADFAEHVLHFYEEKYPNDKRPQKAIEAARQYANGEITVAACAAAWDAAGDAARAAAGEAACAAAWAAAYAAARDAARDAAWDAAWDAAGDAAREAERQWQLKRFKEVLQN